MLSNSRNIFILANIYKRTFRKHKYCCYPVYKHNYSVLVYLYDTFIYYNRKRYIQVHFLIIKTLIKISFFASDKLVLCFYHGEYMWISYWNKAYKWYVRERWNRQKNSLCYVSFIICRRSVFSVRNGWSFNI